MAGAYNLTHASTGLLVVAKLEFPVAKSQFAQSFEVSLQEFEEGDGGCVVQCSAEGVAS